MNLQENNYYVIRNNFSLFLKSLPCNVICRTISLFSTYTYRIRANVIFHYISILKTSKLMSSPIRFSSSCFNFAGWSRAFTTAWLSSTVWSSSLVWSATSPSSWPSWPIRWCLQRGTSSSRTWPSPTSCCAPSPCRSHLLISWQRWERRWFVISYCVTSSFILVHCIKINTVICKVAKVFCPQSGNIAFLFLFPLVVPLPPFHSSSLHSSSYFLLLLVLDPGPEHGVPLQADRDHPGQLRLLLGVLHCPDRSGQIHLHCSSHINSDFNPAGKHFGRILILSSFNFKSGD